MGMLLLFVETIPPTSQTWRHMGSLNRRIIGFTRQHHRLPISLEVLPIPTDELNVLTDGWKEPIQYSRDTNGVVTLRSLGSDKRPGGEGRAAVREIDGPRVPPAGGV